MNKIGFWIGILVFVGLQCLPAPGGMTEAAWHVVAVGLLMGIWWFSEALPLSITALLPFLLFPPLAIGTSKAVAASYISPITFLVLGGSLIALAIEKSGLHRRLALAIIDRGSNSLGAMLLSFMTASACISLITSNTATTLIMMPIALSIIRYVCAPDGKVPSSFATAMVLGVAYAASIGGMGTLVGSPTNAVAAGLIQKLLGIEMNFLTWMAFGIPVVALAIPGCWWWLKRTYALPAIQIDAKSLRKVIGDPGNWNRAERCLIPLLMTVMAAWILVPLLGERLGRFLLDDGAIAMLGAIALFIIPDGKGNRLLDWSDVGKAPWDIILLIGGGFALADGITSSGLSNWTGIQLEGLNHLPLWLIVLLLVTIIIVVTEFASNVATASAFLPVVVGLVLATSTNPLLLAMPAALAASWGFMMPAGTPPNAIAFGTGFVSVRQMIKTGFFINLAGIPFIVGICFLIVTLFF